MPRAAVLHDIADPPRRRGRRARRPRAGEIEVAIAASGVCHSDLSVQRGVVAATTPIVLGHEAAGVVTRLGPGRDGGERGRPCRAVVGALVRNVLLVLARRALPLCVRAEGRRRRNAARRDHSDPHGVRRCAPDVLARDLRRADGRAGAVRRARADRCGAETSRPRGCAVLTGVGAATRTATSATGDTVAVFGCGGVGLNVVQGARLAGAGCIVAIDTSEAKLALAARFGATSASTPRHTTRSDAIRRSLTGAAPTWRSR